LRAAAEQVLPGFRPAPVATERCFYDNTADEDFVIDRLDRVVVGGGSSGHGFKFGPVWGEALADLAEGKAPAIELARFSLARRR
jgi:sarcosine oxidase